MSETLRPDSETTQELAPQSESSNSLPPGSPEQQEHEVKERGTKVYLIGGFGDQSNRVPLEPLWGGTIKAAILGREQDLDEQSPHSRRPEDTNVHIYEMSSISEVRKARGEAPFTMDDMVKTIVNGKPDIIGLSILPSWLGNAQELMSRVREEVERNEEWKKKPPVFVGGGYLTNTATEDVLEALPDIDILVKGRGERPMAEIVAAYNAGTGYEDIPNLVLRTADGEVHETRTQQMEDLMVLHPLRDYWKAQEIVAHKLGKPVPGMVQTSVGCPGRCTFCTLREFGHVRGKKEEDAWKALPAESVVDEMERVATRIQASGTLGEEEIPYIDIVDDEFIGNDPERALEIARLIKERGLEVRFHFLTRADTLIRAIEEHPDFLEVMRNAGAARIFFGLESGSDAQLKRYGKGLNAAVNRRATQLLQESGMEYQAGFIMMDAETTWADIDTNIGFIDDLGIATRITAPTNSMMVYANSPMAKMIGKVKVPETGEIRDLRRKDEHGKVQTTPDGSMVLYDFLDPEIGELSAASKEWNKVSARVLMHMRRELDQLLSLPPSHFTRYHQLIRDAWQDLKRIEWDAFKHMAQMAREGLSAQEIANSNDQLIERFHDRIDEAIDQLKSSDYGDRADVLGKLAGRQASATSL
jgi:radical SAM superfamily enzyme YgiQ (UPF0313 family)